MSLPENESRLEAELKRLTPSPVRERLRSGIARKLEPRRSGARSLLRWSAIALPVAAAAGVAFAFLLGAPSDRSPNSTEPVATGTAPVTEREIFVPIRAVNRLYDAQYLGLVTTPEGGRARKMVYRYLDTVTWRDERTKATLRMTVPRDEVHFINVTGF